MNKNKFLLGVIGVAITAGACFSASAHKQVHNSVVKTQRDNLQVNTAEKGFGPQSPRDIDAHAGSNTIDFSVAPSAEKMNLCNIHFHESAEHKGGEFTKYAGNGDGKGHDSGYKYSGALSKQESTPYKGAICAGKHGGLHVGDTIELHYVHTTAQITPGPTLGACLSESIGNPQLRVEAQVFVLVNDDKAADFGELMQVSKVGGVFQAVNRPTDTGSPVQYAGSTTGPSYNEKGSPFQVTWNVRPKVQKVTAASVAKWCEGNAFDEDHAHGVRNLVKNPALLSEIHK